MLTRNKNLNQIMCVSAKLLEEMDYASITLEKINSNLKNVDLRLYFSQKEDVYLYLLQHELEEWREEVISSIIENKNYSIDHFSNKWTELISKRLRLFRLLILLYSELEKKVSIDSLTWFRLAHKEPLNNICVHISNVLTFINPAQAEDFLYYQIALGKGLLDMTNLSPKQQAAIKNADVDSLHGLFEDCFRMAVTCYLSGLAAKSDTIASLQQESYTSDEAKPYPINLVKTLLTES